MAAKSIDKSVAEAILVDWRVGQLSQQKIAEKHKVSKGLANKLCKGVEQDGAAIVTAGVLFQQALSGHDDRMVTAMTAAVDDISRKLKFFQGASMLVAKAVVSKVQQDGMALTSIAFLPSRSSLVTTRTSSTSSLSKSFLKPLRSDAATDPDTVSTIALCGLTSKPATAIS
jgi:hypothetical protein